MPPFDLKCTMNCGSFREKFLTMPVILDHFESYDRNDIKFEQLNHQRFLESVNKNIENWFMRQILVFNFIIS